MRASSIVVGLMALSSVALSQQMQKQNTYVQVEEATSGRDYVARKSIGHVEAVRTVHVRAAVEGFLQEVCCREGSMVKEGDILFRIDPLRYQAALQQAEAALARIEAQIVYAGNSYKRLAGLAVRQAASTQEVETARTKLEELKASKAGAQADIVKARKDLEDCTIRAEISGRLGRLSFSAGNYITAGEQLVTIMQMDPIYVRFPLSQSDVNGVFGGHRRIGSVTDVRLTTANGMQYPAAGKVEIVDNMLSGATDSYTLWALFENPENTLVPHGIGALSISLTDTMEVTTVPLTAVQYDAQGAFVYTVAEDGTVSRREVVSGSIRGRLQSIYEGLQPGEKVITDGSHKTRVGEKVIPVTPQQQAAAAQKDKPAQQTPAIVVKVEKAVLASDPTVLECRGARVEAVNRVELRPLVQGILDEPAFKEGDRVRKGDVLFRIDPTRYQAAVDAQKSAIRMLEVRINDARQKLERQRTLLARHATSQDECESAKATLDDLLAQKASAEALLTVEEDNLSRCVIHAGVDGRIGRVNFSKGNYIADIKSPLATLVQLSPIYVRFSLSESEILSHFGTIDKLIEDADISLVTATGKAYTEKGRVAFCDNVIQSGTDTQNIWAIFDNAERELQPGGVVTIRVARKADKQVPAIPAAAVQIDTRGRYAYVLRHGRAIMVRILCGSTTPEGLVPVYRGINAGDEVITTNLAELEDGTLVTTN